MFQAGPKAYSFVFCIAILAALSEATIMAEIDFSRLAISSSMDSHLFESYRLVAIVQCVKECKVDHTCIYINYSTLKKLCTLKHHMDSSASVDLHKRKKWGNACWSKPTVYVSMIFMSVLRCFQHMLVLTGQG